MLAKIIIHAADLSNPCRPFNITKRWAECIAREFNAQAAREIELDLPGLGVIVTKTIQDLCKNEIYFDSVIVAPMWHSLTHHFTSLEPLLHQLNENIENWKSILNRLETEESDAAPFI